ncbi:hypothetical protein CEUSTIGMA_g358.t1 [Chlamydomonas eustigma]|uniref:J domain-containing protein n=1 Tax=Chlamydomonas eustigma TaxID=1157962 RepID=A0A250WQ04_9CHLO|nr:hypothetical protein CEUSTIGMA_g358.t1 [Chlamydomonas eustigma]|eukprot:GAX72903.1 hypothetical protein CEUSTIGMA_g358.t1 [Chlamydomonas eustigma]
MNLLVGRKKPDPQPSHCVARYICTKISWRGKYRRILYITPAVLVTLDPSTFKLTNSYSISTDADVDGIVLGAGTDDEGEIVINARGDKKSKFQPLRFLVRGRAQLLTDLFHCMTSSGIHVNPTVIRVLGSADTYVGYRYLGREGAWAPVNIHISCSTLVCTDYTTGEVVFRTDLSELGTPAFSMLGTPTVGAKPEGGIFAVHRRYQRRPELLASRQREALVQVAITSASKRLGLSLRVDSSPSAAASSPEQVLMSCSMLAERNIQALTYLRSWEVLRLQQRQEAPPALMLLDSQMQGKPVSNSGVIATAVAAAAAASGTSQHAVSAPADILQALGIARGAHVVTCQLSLSSSVLVERTRITGPGSGTPVRSAEGDEQQQQQQLLHQQSSMAASVTFSDQDQRVLGGIAALVRFIGDPRLLGIEWVDPSLPPTLYTTTERDDILAALSSAAQAASGRPIPILAGLTAPGDALLGGGVGTSGTPASLQTLNPALSGLSSVTGGGRSCAVRVEAEVERWFLEELAARAKTAHADLSSGAKGMFFNATVDFPTPIMGMELSTPIMSGMDAASGVSGSGCEAIELLVEFMFEFNACIPYAGPSEAAMAVSKQLLDPQVVASLMALLPVALQPGLPCNHLPQDDAKMAISALQCLQRLSTWHDFAEALMASSGAIGRVFAAYCCGCDAVVCEAARLLLRFWAPAAARSGTAPWMLLSKPSVDVLPTSPTSPHAMASPTLPTYEPSHADLLLSKAAKALCFTNSNLEQRCTQLLTPLARLGSTGRPGRSLCASGGPPSPSTSAAVIELVSAVACEPWSTLTDSKLLAQVLKDCAAIGRPLFSLFQHPAADVADGATLLMAAIAGAGAEAAEPLREAALAEGAVLTHLHRALFSASGSQAQLSRQLIACWCDEHPASLALMRRTFPPGLVRFLNVSRQQEQQQHSQATPMLQLQVPPHAQQQSNPNPPSASTEGAGPAPLPGKHIQGQNVGGSTGSSTGPGATLPGDQQHYTVAPLNSQNITTAVAATVNAAHPASHQLPPGVAPPAPAPPADAAPLMHPPAASPSLPPSPAPTLAQAGSPSQAAVSAARGVGLRGNWPAFWAACLRDHRHAGLIWNQTTRLELRDALEKEEAGFRSGKVSTSSATSPVPNSSSSPNGKILVLHPCWNHSEFAVEYPSLDAHLNVGGIYVSLLIEGGDADAVNKVPNPKDLFHALYHRYLNEGDWELRLQYGAVVDNPSSSSPVDTASTKVATAVSVTQELCLRAMTAVYSAHAGAIGPVEVGAMLHLLRVMDITTRRPIRQRVLQLLHALLMPETSSPQSQRSARTNAYSLVGGGGSTAPGSLSGVELLVHLLATAHEDKGAATARLMAASAPSGTPSAGIASAGMGSARPVAPLLLAATAHEEVPHEWWWYPRGFSPKGDIQDDVTIHQNESSGPGGRLDPHSAPLQDGHGRAGPLSKQEISWLHSKSLISSTSTYFWASGMVSPMPLGQIRELRWWLATGPSPLGPGGTPRLALHIILSLVRLQAAADAVTGAPLMPQPRVHRILTSPRCLPHLCQIFLTQEPDLVTGAATLLREVLVPSAVTSSTTSSGSSTLADRPAAATTRVRVSEAYNQAVMQPTGEHALPASPALSRLYLTGALYFALSYVGSNLEEVAAFLRATHLRQSFKGVPHASDVGLPLAQRSYLGHVLPESLIHVLEVYGPSAFANALAGDSETPEVVWGHAMRMGRLLPQLNQHLGDFPTRLSQRWSQAWDYAPLPPLSYPELAEEMWCHRYYLQSLCDEIRFPDWQIQDHVQLLQALFSAWREELARQPLTMTEGEACSILGISGGADGKVSEEEMRRAYRNLARKLHPDKNPDPEARPLFQRLQKAYERLQAGAQGGQGPQMWRLLLILRCQVIMYRRYPSVLQPFKYAGYPLLLEALGRPPSSTASSSGSDKTASAEVPVSALSPESMQLTQMCVELCWLTCVASQRNAEELLRAGGVDSLSSILYKFIPLVQQKLPGKHSALALTNATQVGRKSLSMEQQHQEGGGRDDQIASVLTSVLRCLAVLAATSHSAREALAGQPDLVAAVAHCCSLMRVQNSGGASGPSLRCAAAVEAALLAVAYMCAHEGLQRQLLEGPAVVLSRVMPLLFGYDSTLSTDIIQGFEVPFSISRNLQSATVSSTLDGATAAAAGAMTAETPLSALFRALDTPLERPGLSSVLTYHAILAARCLARLAGVLPPPHSTPHYEAARLVIGALLTPPLAIRLSEPDLRPLLQLLTGSLESPTAIWDPAMREELLTVLREMEEAGGCNTTTVSKWSHTRLMGELQLGGVFVRVYNAQPSPPPPNTEGFCKALVTFLYERLIETPPEGGLLQLLRQMAEQTPSSSMGGVAGQQDNVTRETGLAALGAAGQSLVSHLRQVLQALGLLLQSDARLLGLVASTSAIAPIAACMQPAALLTGDCAARGKHEPGLVLEAADQLAVASIELLLLMTQNAGCQAAMTQELHTVRCLYWIAYCPTSYNCLDGSLRLLRAVAGQQQVCVVAAGQGGALLLLNVLLRPGGMAPGAWPWPWPKSSTRGGDTGSRQEELATQSAVQAAVQAAGLLARLAGVPGQGALVVSLLQSLLPAGIVAALLSGEAEQVVSELAREVETPEVMWDSSMRQATLSRVVKLSKEARAAHASGKMDVPIPVMEREGAVGCAGELYCGGVYVRLYLKDPGFPLREPRRFAEGLMERYVQTTKKALQQQQQQQQAHLPGDAEAVLLSAAAVELLRSHPALCEHVVSLGYGVQLLSTISTLAVASLPGDVMAATLGTMTAPTSHTVETYGGSALRLIHQISANSVAAEGLSTAPAPLEVVPILLKCLTSWRGPASILVLETLKRLLAVENRNRDLVVRQALRAGLPELLLGMLDWRGAAAAVPASGAAAAAAAAVAAEDRAVVRVVTVEVVTALSLEGPFAAQVAALLEASEVWQAYRHQRHDLFLPAGAVTGGSVARLLKGPEATRFALPAPEALLHAVTSPAPEALLHAVTSPAPEALLHAVTSPAPEALLHAVTSTAPDRASQGSSSNMAESAAVAAVMSASAAVPVAAEHATSQAAVSSGIAQVPAICAEGVNNDTLNGQALPAGLVVQIKDVEDKSGPLG